MTLADRIEQATEGSRELDAEIALEIGIPASTSYGDKALGNFYHAPTFFKHYTTSIDAAMQLVPEGAGFNLDRYWIASADGPVWKVEIGTGGIPDKPRQVFDCWDAATPALAICAAAIRGMKE